MKPHKYAEFIKAKADGRTIQYNAIVNQGNEKGWCDMEEDDFDFGDGLEYRIKPAAPKWPETTMTHEQIYTIWSKQKETCNGGDLEAVANAALAHALETGQVVLPDNGFVTTTKRASGGSGSGFFEEMKGFVFVGAGGSGKGSVKK